MKTDLASIVRSAGAGITINRTITPNSMRIRIVGNSFGYPQPPHGEGWQLAIRNPYHLRGCTMWRRVSLGKYA